MLRNLLVRCSRLIFGCDTGWRRIRAQAAGCLALLAVGLVAIQDAVAEGEQDGGLPYSVEVRRARTPLRAGPGVDYYATRYLPVAFKLQVYREEGPWLGVRPPEGEVSFVARRYVQATDRENVGQIVGTLAVSWIGTQAVAPADLKWQVKLRNGEKIRLVGSQKLRLVSDGQPAEVYKITPPPGEFRWIHRDETRVPGTGDPPGRPRPSVAADSPNLAADHDADGDPNRQPFKTIPVKAGAFKTVPIETVPIETVPAATKTVQPASTPKARSREPRRFVAAGSRPPRRLVPAADRQGPEALLSGHQIRVDALEVLAEPVSGATPSAAWQAVKRSQSPGHLPAGSRDAGPDQTDTPTEPLELTGPQYATGALGEVNAELTRIVAENPEAWNLGPLRRRAMELIRSSSTPVERGRARLMLERISGFEAIQRRQSRLQLAASTLPGSPTRGDSPIGTGVGTSPRLTTRYDGSGWLVPVHSAKRTAPPFALMDDQGRVLQLVSPAPGVNLHRYVRKQVGILGNRGYSEPFKRPHLTAQTVIQLNRHRR